jgi:hypothetical protein
MEYIPCTAYPPKKVVQTFLVQPTPPKKVVQTIEARNAPVNLFTAHCKNIFVVLDQQDQIDLDFLFFVWDQMRFHFTLD